MNQNESGRSMAEMMAVLGIIGTLTVGVLAGIRWGLVSGGAFKLQNDVEYAAQEVQELCAWNNSWDDCAASSGDVDNWPSSLSTNNFTSAVEDGEEYLVLKTKDKISVRQYRRMINAAYTTWAPGLLHKVVLSDCSTTNATTLPLQDGTWMTICGGYGAEPSVMEFWVIK